MKPHVAGAVIWCIRGALNPNPQLQVSFMQRPLETHSSHIKQLFKASAQSKRCSNEPV